ncbi:MAG: orotidine-5'-phosphate decarboxylase [Candidatus Omnitrophota bacterium]
MTRTPYPVSRTPRIILALDVDNVTQAKRFVNKLYPQVKIFKVGLQLFTICGHEIIDFIRSKGGEVFLDLKFFDIPNTVANAVIQAVRLRVKMLTLHISGGKEMIAAAVNAAKREAEKLKIEPPLLIGVTVLTSKNAKPCEVLMLAKQGLNYGLDGIVCSVRETAYLRKRINKDFYIITPGIRPITKSLHISPFKKGNQPNFPPLKKGGLRGDFQVRNKDDQKRIATPKQAAEAGSDFLVIGRPILEAANPKEAVKKIERY